MGLPNLEPLPPDSSGGIGDPAVAWLAWTPGQRRAFIEQYARSRGFVPVSLPVDYYSDVPPAIYKVDDGVNAPIGPTTDGSSPLGLSLTNWTLPSSWWLYALAAVLVLGALAVHHRRA